VSKPLKKAEVHICMGCGKDTTARGQVCRLCYSMAKAPQDVIDYEIAQHEGPYRDEYEREAERRAGLDRE
jgi:predicted amidophosphoribosyltransferase